MIASSLPGMFKYGRNKPSILYNSPQHLRNRLLLIIWLVVCPNRQTNVDGAALCGSHLASQASLRQVDLARVGGVNLEHGHSAGNLHLK